MIIKYLSLNIWMGKVFENASEFLKRENADIVVLQEVMDSENGENLGMPHKLKAVLQIDFGYQYSVYMPLALDKRYDPPALFGNMILSKFPILNSQQVFFDRPFVEWDPSILAEDFPRGLLCAQLDLGAGKKLDVFNIHGIWGKHGNDTDRRLNMIDIILKTIGSKHPVILSGDFNLNENVYPHEHGKADLTKPQRTQSVARIEKSFVNVFKDERISSFNPKHKDFITTGYAYAVVDMVFVSPDIKVLSHIQPNEDVSDHMPQVVEISL